MTVTDCPFCDLPADVTDRWTWPSTSGPVPHIETVCVAGCIYAGPEERHA